MSQTPVCPEHNVLCVAPSSLGEDWLAVERELGIPFICPICHLAPPAPPALPPGIKPEHLDPARCPGCKNPVPEEYTTLAKVICPACGRWELYTGIIVCPVTGEPGTPPSILGMSEPLWRPVPPSAPTDTCTTPAPREPDWESVVAAVADENAVAIIKIASDESLTTDQQMRDIYKLDRRVLAWDSPRWARLLRVTDAMVRRTDWWRVDRKRLRG